VPPGQGIKLVPGRDVPYACLCASKTLSCFGAFVI